MPRDVAASEQPAPPVLGEPEKLADPPSDGDTVPLHLYVSNQSVEISPVGIDVWLDGTHVVTGGFEVGGQHNWILFELRVPPGTHALHAEGRGGAIVLDITVPVAGERWGVLDFWYYYGDPGPRFIWNLSDTPVVFN